MSVVKSKDSGITWKSSDPKPFQTVEQMQAEIEQLRDELFRVQNLSDAYKMMMGSFRAQIDMFQSMFDWDLSDEFLLKKIKHLTAATIKHHDRDLLAVNMAEAALIEKFPARAALQAGEAS